jgi:hypothetical protein
MCASRLFIVSLRRQIGTAIVAIMQTPMIRIDALSADFV